MTSEELGFLAINNKDHQEAINIFKRALEKKKTVNAFMGFGLAHYHLEDFLTARWAFNKVLELDANNKEAIDYIEKIDKIEKNKTKPLPRRQSFFRTMNDYFEIFDGKWKSFFIKGINLGLGLPGYSPGEYPIKKGTYLKWFEMIYQLGINAIRIYTIHPPSFYEAFYQFNQHKEKLYLFQGIWTELPENNDFYESEYLNYIINNIKNTIDIIFGNAYLPEKRGYPDGRYEHDISPFTIGFIFGREWESCAVRIFNEKLERIPSSYEGKFLCINNASPFEKWITERLDFMLEYEYEKYGLLHPVSTISWPTLDPLNHPSESNHEDDLLLQGLKPAKEVCNENEDMESLSLSGIKSLKESSFFITYHVYPYYPDFMNNDYLHEKNPYFAYLKELKSYYGNIPVLIGEFGVPSSREITHWHKEGWHHGGHNESRQGEINGLLMKAIFESGMAGGILFSWFDEWFKRNWLFSPYVIPPERNSLWFNLQDAEQNYGLMAMYPNYPQKKVNLSGQKNDWINATILYEKKAPVIFRFDDGADDARTLEKMMVQHDEGFLYVLIETKGKINFSKAHYLIGIDTFSSESGEFLLPFNLNVKSPIGLKFLFHIAGTNKSRVLVCKNYDKYLNTGRGEIKPIESHQGEWVTMQNKTNERRFSKDGKSVYPARIFTMSNLRFGSLDIKSPFYDSLADFFYKENMIELRIPWSLINFTDPSSKRVLWMDKQGNTKKTEGIKFIAISYKPEDDHLFAKRTGMKTNMADSLPENLLKENIKTYSWEEWDSPIYFTYLKRSYFKYKEFLTDIP